MTGTFDGRRRRLLTAGSAAAALWATGLSQARALGAAAEAPAAGSGAGAGVGGGLQLGAAFRRALVEGAAGDEALAAFYRDSGWEPLWVSDTARAAERREALFQALGTAGDHGLPVAGYGLEALLQTMQGRRSERELGELELALSKLLLRYAAQLQTGILRPGTVDPGLVLTVPLRDGAQLLHGFARGNPRAVLRGLAPPSPEYGLLLREKLRLEDLAARGGWAPPVAGGPIKPGAAGAQVVALRNRLISMGYLRRTALTRYDADLQGAVQIFQLDHGMTPDGIAGEQTLAELNRPLSERLGAILVALERERWMNMDLGARHVWVNIAGFTTEIRDQGQVVLRTRSVVGASAPDRRSPEFSDRMQTVVANPSWSVPRSIAVKEYLPGLRRNPGASGHLQVIDRQGRVVDRASVDFSAYTAQNFPYSLRQPPSAGNALGLVKFLFPNKWNIYLHDTPAKALFQKDMRAFSHGCIRLADPFDFAYAVLSRQSDDPQKLFQSHLKGGRESAIRIESDLPVHLTYRTAFASPRGRMNYRRDVYGRDARILAALREAGVETLPAAG